MRLRQLLTAWGRRPTLARRWDIEPRGLPRGWGGPHRRCPYPGCPHFHEPPATPRAVPQRFGCAGGDAGDLRRPCCRWAASARPRAATAATACATSSFTSRARSSRLRIGTTATTAEGRRSPTDIAPLAGGEPRPDEREALEAAVERGGGGLPPERGLSVARNRQPLAARARPAEARTPARASVPISRYRGTVVRALDLW
jgi:hypothetical protein